MTTRTFSVEVLTLPVSDVDRAVRFYVERVGFTLDVDYAPTEAFRVVQLTPPGSSCSIQIGIGLTDEPAGSVRNTYLVVTDLEAARNQLLERGVEIGKIRHKTPIGGDEAVILFEPARYDIGDTRNAAWSYRAPFEEMARIADLVSFYPEKLTMTIDGEKLEPAPGQNVISHGPDRNLSVDEIGGIQLVEDAAAAET